MGRRRNETTVEERKIIIRLHNNLKSLSKVARSRSTIQSMIHRIGARQSVLNKPRSGRPRILTIRDESSNLHCIKKNPRISAPYIVAELQRAGITVSASTVRSVCNSKGYNGRVARKKFYVSSQNRKKRLEFSRKYRDKTQWRNQRGG